MRLLHSVQIAELASVEVTSMQQIEYSHSSVNQSDVHYRRDSCGARVDGPGFLFFLQIRRPLVLQTLEVSSPGVPASPFLELAESEVAGTYKWMSKSGSESLITLNIDHTFSKGDTTNPQHRWETSEMRS